MSPATRLTPQVPNVRLLLLLLFAVALVLRVGAALVLDHRNRQRGIEHEFADSELYWKLALRLAAGEPYDDGKRQVLRTPGYPLFLAGSIRSFGPSLVGARHMQAAVGALSCVLVFFLVRKLLDTPTAAIAAALAAIYPYAVFLSAVLLSETLFTALLLVQLLLVTHWVDSLTCGHSIGRLLFTSLLLGLCGAAATLVRPSWILVTPIAALLALAYPIRSQQSAVSSQQSDLPDCRLPASRRLAVMITVLLGFIAGMAPWWVRNRQVTGHTVLTTLWVGASLYDGLNERANGSSDMEFMDEPVRFGLNPALRQMSEWDQDQYLRHEAWKFAQAHPQQVLKLALIKWARFWNPLPNAPQWQTWPLQLVSLFSGGSVLALAVLGAWYVWGRWNVLVILAGPVLYFSAIHLVFVSSLRYREAAMLPVLGLAAVTLRKIVEARTARNT